MLIEGEKKKMKMKGKERKKRESKRTFKAFNTTPQGYQGMTAYIHMNIITVVIVLVVMKVPVTSRDWYHYDGWMRLPTSLTTCSSWSIWSLIIYDGQTDAGEQGYSTPFPIIQDIRTKAIFMCSASASIMKRISRLQQVSWNKARFLKKYSFSGERDNLSWQISWGLGIRPMQPMI